MLVAAWVDDKVFLKTRIVVSVDATKLEKRRQETMTFPSSDLTRFTVIVFWETSSRERRGIALANTSMDAVKALRVTISRTGTAPSTTALNPEICKLFPFWKVQRTTLILRAGTLTEFIPGSEISCTSLRVAANVRLERETNETPVPWVTATTR